MKKISAQKYRELQAEKTKQPDIKPAAPSIDKDFIVAKSQANLSQAQIQATEALTEIASQALQNPQMEQIIQLLSQPKENKRLIVNRDSKGLITTIDIQVI